MTCAECSRQVELHARGLCPHCYQRARVAGRLEDYPAIRPDNRTYLPLHVDEVAVARAAAGDRVRLNVTERNAAVVQLTRAGLSAREIAHRLGVAQRTVVRHRTGQIVRAA